MKSVLAKQFLLLGQRPILAYSLLAFDHCDPIRDIYVVLRESDMGYCRERILTALRLNKPIRLVKGGARRQDSVRKALSAIRHPAPFVVIHDAARPFVRTGQISDCLKGAVDSGACILAVPVADTLKKANTEDRVLKTIDRQKVWMAQTPQAFEWSLINQAHQTAWADGFEGTDDAELVERLNKDVGLISGSRSNIKITTPEDLRLARTLMGDIGPHR